MNYSFSFNGIRKEFLYCEEDGNEHSAFAPISRNILSIPGLPGGQLVSTDTQVRTIRQAVFFKGNDKFNLFKLEEELAAWLITPEPVELIFDYEPDRKYYAVVDGSFDIRELLEIGEGTITFICPDPYKYGEEKSINIGIEPIVNQGTVETSPIFTTTFTSATTDFKITHVQTGNWVRVVRDFVPGDVLLVDLSKRKVIINGVVSMPTYDWRSKPFKLLPGENTFTFAPLGVAEVSIRFRPKWK